MSKNMIAKEHTQSFRVCRVQDLSSLPTSSTFSPPPVPRHNILNTHPRLSTYHSISQYDEHVYKVKARYLQDPVTAVHQTFILWNDVRVLIKDAEYALDSDGSLIPFIINDNCEEIIPRRIMCHPDKVLEVVVSTTVPLETSVANDAVNGRRRLSKLDIVWIVFAGPVMMMALGLAYRIAKG